MRVTRILDLMVLLLLAAVVLIPRADATVKPALALDPELQDRVAELQSVLVGKPASVDVALELANLYLDGHRPDWALATIGPALGRAPTTTACTTCARSPTPTASTRTPPSRRPRRRWPCASATRRREHARLRTGGARAPRAAALGAPERRGRPT